MGNIEPFKMVPISPCTRYTTWFLWYRFYNRQGCRLSAGGACDGRLKFFNIWHIPADHKSFRFVVIIGLRVDDEHFCLILYRFNPLNDLLVILIADISPIHFNNSVALFQAGIYSGWIGVYTTNKLTNLQVLKKVSLYLCREKQGHTWAEAGFFRDKASASQFFVILKGFGFVVYQSFDFATNIFDCKTLVIIRIRDA